MTDVSKINNLQPEELHRWQTAAGVDLDGLHPDMPPIPVPEGEEDPASQQFVVTLLANGPQVVLDPLTLTIAPAS